jgi:hypothetical protein
MLSRAGRVGNVRTRVRYGRRGVRSRAGDHPPSFTKIRIVGRGGGCSVPRPERAAPLTPLLFLPPSTRSELHGGAPDRRTPRSSGYPLRLRRAQRCDRLPSMSVRPHKRTANAGTAELPTGSLRPSRHPINSGRRTAPSAAGQARRRTAARLAGWRRSPAAQR